MDVGGNDIFFYFYVFNFKMNFFIKYGTVIVNEILNHILTHTPTNTWLPQSLGVVEYNDCTSTEG